MKAHPMLSALAALAIAALPRVTAAQSANDIARGAEIYGKQCARCHNLRSPTEYGDQDWISIIAQMRARANLTRDQARAVLAFVQATNLPAAPGTALVEPTHPTDAVQPVVLSPALRVAIESYIKRLEVPPTH